MKVYYYLIILLFTLLTLTYSLPATNQKEGKSTNVLRSIIKSITIERNNDNVIENVESPKPVIGLISQPDADPNPDPDADPVAGAVPGSALGCSSPFGCRPATVSAGIIGLIAGCSHIPVFGCIIGAAAPF